MEQAARIAVWVVTLYGLAGLVFAVPFVIWGVDRIDPAARRSRLGFRLLILPGVVALWPVLARRWLRRVPPPGEHTAHRRLAATGTRDGAP